MVCEDFVAISTDLDYRCPTMPDQLPTFEHPPLDEMVMGVQFAPLGLMRAVHLGLFWSQIRADYPSAEDQMPLQPVVEEAELKPHTTSLTIRPVDVPPLPRCWFATEDKTRLIQIQRDRFLRNWRRVEGNERYPRFGRLAQDFKLAWEKFVAFIMSEGLGPVNVNQCEVSYINQIDREAGWDELGELNKVFPFLQPRDSKKFLPPAELFSWQARYKLPEGRGRLHVEMNPAFRARDMKLVLSLNLTARGAPAGSSLEQIAAWFDLAHEWAIRAFVELTGPTAHEKWGMTYA
jgi:uncharacterized protein (TIGR04255 family)